MDLGDLKGKAKDLLSEHEDQVDKGIDEASDAIQDRTPDNIDGAVETAGEKAKDAL